MFEQHWLKHGSSLNMILYIASNFGYRGNWYQDLWSWFEEVLNTDYLGKEPVEPTLGIGIATSLDISLLINWTWLMPYNTTRYF